MFPVILVYWSPRRWFDRRCNRQHPVRVFLPGRHDLGGITCVAERERASGEGGCTELSVPESRHVVYTIPSILNGLHKR